MLGQKVTVKVDRPMGIYHPEHKDMYYPINYGYIEGIMAPAGEEQDAYLLGLDKPVEEYTGIIIAIIHRYDDVEEKWVVAPENMTFSVDEIERQVHWAGITFPGGHVEPRESFVESVVREVKEETGLDIANVQLCGVKQFTHRDGKYRYIVFFYKTNTYSGELKSSDEGKVFWIDKNDLKDYALADGFEGMFEVFENDNLTENYWWLEDDEWIKENK